MQAIASPVQFAQTVCAAGLIHGNAKITRLGVGTTMSQDGFWLIAASGASGRLDVETTVVASAGVSGPATPASVAGFAMITINGVARRLAFYNAK